MINEFMANHNEFVADQGERPAVRSPTFTIALSIDGHAVEIRTGNTDPILYFRLSTVFETP